MAVSCSQPPVTSGTVLGAPSPPALPPPRPCIDSRVESQHRQGLGELSAPTGALENQPGALQPRAAEVWGPRKQRPAWEWAVVSLKRPPPPSTS